MRLTQQARSHRCIACPASVSSGLTAVPLLVEDCVGVCVTLADAPTDCETDGVDVRLLVQLPETLLEADDEALTEAEDVCTDAEGGSSGHGFERNQR
jgi:hypothetical protein